MMKTFTSALLLFAIALTGCSVSKPQPKLCTVTIPEPPKSELNKYKPQPGKKCKKRKSLWSQFGIEK